MKLPLNIVWIIGFALVLRIGYVAVIPQAPVQGDAREYDAIGWNIAQGNGFSLDGETPTALRSPVYPLVLSFLFSVFGHDYLPARIFQAILGALTCLIVYQMGILLFDKTVALFSAVLLAAYPVLIAYSGLMLTETLFTFLLAAALYYFFRWTKRRSWPGSLLAGFLLALCILTRPTALLIPVFLLGADFLLRDRKAGIPLPQVMLLIAALAACVIPWTLRNHARFNAFIPLTTYHGSVFFYTTMRGGPSPEILREVRAIAGQGGDEFGADALFKQKIRDLLRNDTWQAFAGIVKAARFIPKFWITSHSSVFGIDRPNADYLRERRYTLLAAKALLLMVHLVILAAAAGGILLSRNNFRSTALVLVLFVYFSLHLNDVSRYHLPVMPYLLMLSGVSVASFFRRKAINDENTARQSVV